MPSRHSDTCDDDHPDFVEEVFEFYGGNEIMKLSRADKFQFSEFPMKIFPRSTIKSE